MLTLSRSSARSLLVAGALLALSAPAFAQQQGGGGSDRGPGEGGGGSDVYAVLLKDPAKPKINCLTTHCVEERPNNPRRPSRVSRRSKPTEACRSMTPERDWTTAQWIEFNTCSARRL